MSLIQKIKIGLTTIFFAMVFLNGVPAAHADFAGDFGEWLGSAFSTGDDSVSFTQYEGESITLDTEGFSEELVASQDFRGFIIRVVNFALSFLGLLAVLIVIYGGVLYVTAAGEEERTQKGKKAITYAAIGLLIVLGSFAFVNTIIGGATGETNVTGTSVTAGTTGGGFNASAEQVRSLAIDMFNNFAFVAETSEEINNIVNDVQKTSLTPTSLPAKTDIMSFLRSVKSKLQNIDSRVPPFSQSSVAVKNLIREVDSEIDNIESFNTPWYAHSDGRECDPEADTFEEGFFQGLEQQNHCLNEGASPYYRGLYAAWEELHQKYNDKNDSSALGQIMTPITTDYLEQFDQDKENLESIFNSVSNISAVQGGAQSYYDSMIASYNSHRTKIAQGNVPANIDSIGNDLITGLQQQANLFASLQEIQFVQARLTANTVNGNAPLTVIFDTLGTVDPAGGSIQGGNITWDLAGTKSFDELSKDSSGEVIIPQDGSMTCDFDAPAGTTEEEFIGTTSKRCVFHRPGTYTAAIKVDSNSPSQYAAGISILTIKVQPPATKIELKMNAGGSTQTIMHYEDDVLLTDKRIVYVTTNEAAQGIQFDASGTNADRFRWTFGNGEIQEFSGDTSATAVYEDAGRYEVILEVLSPLGELDRKIFTLEVAGVAARINRSTFQNTFINQAITFDGTQSRSDLGDIKEYRWEITPSPGQTLPDDAKSIYPVEESGPSLRSVTHTFKYPLDYDVSLTVTDSAGNSATDIINNFKVQSQTPIALFEATNEDLTQPGTYILDGGKSYDPDGTNEFLEYEWSIESETGGKWQFINNTDSSSKRPIVKFTDQGSYEVTLKVTDGLTQPPNEESDQIVQTIEVNNVLDIDWAEDQQVTAILDQSGKAKLDFRIISDNAIAYEIDFGDGDVSSGDISGSKIIPHTYTDGGKYNVKVTVFDSEDNDTSIQRRVFIGGGDSPIAKIDLAINDATITDLTSEIEIYKGDVITFDASESKNTDGTGRKLNYSWDFGDTSRSSNRIATHAYSELSPRDPGYYTVTLKVSDEDEPSISDTDSIRVRVNSAPPTFSSIQAIPETVSGNLITPVVVNIQAFGATDPDGRITQYKWWYYNVQRPDEPLGIQITQTNSARLTIGTNGQEGQEITYGFGLEVTDSDNLKASSSNSQLPVSTLTVTNGPNDLPTARFNVNATKLFIGDPVGFTSSSQDPDGRITTYIWDFEGDGFFNNEPTSSSTIQHTYTEPNLNGYDVRLKVVDDKGGEAVSDIVKIFVDTLADAPVAAFETQVVPQSNGRRLKFLNNSTADEQAGAQLARFEWDFNTNVDSNGDGIPDNDIDSREQNPEHSYIVDGNYTVKLRVVDDQGRDSFITDSVSVPLANPPAAAFEYQIIGNNVIFSNKSTPDLVAGTEIIDYVWDFNSQLDSDGDGRLTNDVDSKLKNPVHEYSATGNYEVSLTVTDNQGNKGSVTALVNFSQGGGGLADEPQSGQNNLTAILSSNPSPRSDGIVYLNGNSASVTFDFSKSIGPIETYVIDKNIYFDTDGNGIKNDDADFKTTLPGRWTANFLSEWGKTVVKLTVSDIYGNQDTILQEIKFQ